MYEYINTRCIPSYLSSEVCGFPEDSGLFSSLQLLQGEVKKAIYPGDPTSNSTICVEYTVDVEYRVDNGPSSVVTFPNCRVVNLLGGAADKCRYTLRPDPNATPVGQVFGTGSKVLVLCLAGEKNRGYIVGGIREDSHVDTLAEGHNWYWEFNGISESIDKDGQYTLQFAGPTKVDGSPDTSGGVQSSDWPTTLAITKDGSLEIYTKNRNQFFKLDHANKKVTFQADSEYNIQVNGKQISNVTGSVDWTFGNKCSIAISNDTKIDVSGGKLDVSASGKMTIKTAGVAVGAATDNWPLFTTYRKAQAQLHQKLEQYLLQASVALASAGASMATPVTGAVAAGPNILQAGTALAQAMAALVSFEAQGIQFESMKNSND